MMAVHPSSEEIADLLATLGFAKDRVAGFTIDCRPHAAAMVTVEVYLEKSDIQTLSGTIKRYYELVPVGDLKKAETLRDRYQDALREVKQWSLDNGNPNGDITRIVWGVVPEDFWPEEAKVRGYLDPKKG